MNKIILMGGIGKDAEAQKVGENTVIKFPFATSRKWKNKAGEMQEKISWHNITIWRKEGLFPYLKKGTKLLLEGEIEYNKYEKDGEKKYFTSINVHNVEFCGGKQENPNPMDKVKAAGEGQRNANIPGGEDDGLPF